MKIIIFALFAFFWVVYALVILLGFASCYSVGKWRRDKSFRIILMILFSLPVTLIQVWILQTFLVVPFFYQEYGR